MELNSLITGPGIHTATHQKRYKLEIEFSLLKELSSYNYIYLK